MPMRLTPLASVAPAAIETLLDAAFGRDRHARTAYRIREGMTALPDLSFAAHCKDVFVGSLQSWPIVLDVGAGVVPLVLVGPVAVAPAHQRRGIGRALMDALVAAAPATTMTMIGDPEYYGAWGFATASAGWRVPGPVEARRLLVRRASDLPLAGMLGPRAFALGDTNA